jgi:hypothetical protein
VLAAWFEAGLEQGCISWDVHISKVLSLVLVVAAPGPGPGSFVVSTIATDIANLTTASSSLTQQGDFNVVRGNLPDDEVGARNKGEWPV